MTWDDDLLRPLLGVMTSAVNVLTSKKLYGRVARCARKGCGPRGDRAKARRHYHAKVKPKNKELRKRVEESVRKLMKDPEGA